MPYNILFFIETFTSPLIWPAKVLLFSGLYRRDILEEWEMCFDHDFR